MSRRKVDPAGDYAVDVHVSFVLYVHGISDADARAKAERLTTEVIGFHAADSTLGPLGLRVTTTRSRRAFTSIPSFDRVVKKVAR